MAVDPTLVMPEAPPPYAVRLFVMRPNAQSKLLNLPFFGWVVRFVLSFPHNNMIKFLHVQRVVARWMSAWAILLNGR
jgi:hypothetical protein